MALGPHPQRELTLMPRFGFAWPQLGMAAGASFFQWRWLSPVLQCFVADQPDQPLPLPPPVPRPPRAEPREVVELKQLKTEQPELASAADMQIALVDMQRRVQSRVPLPWIQVDSEWVRTQRAAGRPIVRFTDIPLEWTDFRLTFRQTADILRRHDAVEPAEIGR